MLFLYDICHVYMNEQHRINFRQAFSSVSSKIAPRYTVSRNSYLKRFDRSCLAERRYFIRNVVPRNPVYDICDTR